MRSRAMRRRFQAFAQRLEHQLAQKAMLID
jgi:hypothetical protein